MRACDHSHLKSVSTGLVKISGVMPISASDAVVVSRSSSHHGVKKSGDVVGDDAIGDGTVREQVVDEDQSSLPDNAEAIARTAASSSTDIRDAADLSP